MARKYAWGTEFKDPIASGLTELTQGIQARNELKARREEAALNRILQEKAQKLAQDKFDAENAPIKITEGYLDALGPELSQGIRREKSEFSESNYDAGKPYAEYAKPKAEMESLKDAYKAHSEYLQAKKLKADANKEKPIGILGKISKREISPEIDPEYLIDPSDFDKLTAPAKEGAKEEKKQDYVPAKVFYGGVDKVPAGMDPEYPIPIGNQTLKPPGSEKEDSNSVPQDIMEWFNSGLPSSEFPKGYTSLTPRSQGLLNARIKQEENRIAQGIGIDKFNVTSGLSRASGERDKERLKMAKTADDKKTLALRSGITQLNRLRDAVEIADRIDPNFQKGLKSRAEGIGAYLGVRDQSPQSLEYEEMLGALDVGNVREILEGAGKTMTANEVKTINRIQVMPNKTKEQVKVKARAMMGFLRDSLEDRYKAVSAKTPYGLEDYPAELSAAYEGVKSVAGDPLINRVRSGAPMASDAGAKPKLDASKQRRLNELYKKRDELLKKKGG